MSQQPEQETKPILTIDPPYLEFGAASHSLLNLGKPDLILTITNSGTGLLTGRIKPQVSWLSIVPSEFECGAGESSQHAVHIHQEARNYWDAGGRFLNNLFLVISNAGSVKINGSYTALPKSSGRTLVSRLMILSGILIIAGLIGIGFFTFGLNGSKTVAQEDMTVLFTQGAATEFARLTQTLYPSDTPQPTQVTVEPTRNLTPSPTATYTPWPRDKYNPEAFVKEYYDAINNQEYDKAWDMLSMSFKDECCNISGNDPFEEYKNWWKTINKVDVVSAYIQAYDQNPAEVWVNLNYHYNDGKTEEARSAIYIIDDEFTNTLLIDVVKPLQ